MSYKILVFVVEEPIDLTHYIFKNYEEISFNQTKEAGFAYFSGDYSNEEQANASLATIKKKYPSAYIVKERRYLNNK